MQSHSPVAVNGECSTLSSHLNGDAARLKDGAVACAKQATLSNGDSKQVILKPKLSKRDEEVIRLIGQHLRELGMEKSADALMNESGCCQEHHAAPLFRKQVLEGNWTKIETTLLELKPLLRHPKHLQRMRFYIFEQKYLELIEDGRLLEALHCLRNEITPLRKFVARVHELAGFLMLKDDYKELRKQAKWDGKGPKSRARLMDKLRIYLPEEIMLPPGRLRSLLSQAIELQQRKCTYHNATITTTLESVSLLTDHVCSRKNIPTHLKQVLSDHCDDVWFCKFSHDGKKLATGSKDAKLMLWDVDPVTHHVTHSRTFDGHTHGVAYLSWSPDDSHILACGTEESSEFWIWNARTGEFRKHSHSNDDSLSCCEWMPDGEKFVTGGIKGQFYQCDAEGAVVDAWDGVRVQCLACLPDNKTVLAADTQHRIRAYNFEDMSDYDCIREDNPIMSFSVTRDGKSALLNVSEQGLHLWDIEDRVLVHKYQGISQGYYTIFSSCGGAQEEFIASGSKDSNIYVWIRSKPKPIHTLTGHTKTVNCVSWNPVYHNMLASVSEDCTVRIWGPQDEATSDAEDED